jgi:hypothetical protein
MMDMQEFMAAFAAMFSSATAWRSETGFPKIKSVNGAHFMLDEPLNPDWRPGPTDHVFGSGSNYLADPSNGTGGAFPRRSPAGYPLVYGIEGDGTPSARLPARVLYGGTTHDDDAAVKVWIERSAARDRALAAYRVDDWNGTIPASSLTDEDWCWTLRRHADWRHIIGGQWDYIRRRQMEAQYNLMPRFDEALYNGQLRAFG